MRAFTFVALAALMAFVANPVFAGDIGNPGCANFIAQYQNGFAVCEVVTDPGTTVAAFLGNTTQEASIFAMNVGYLPTDKNAILPVGASYAVKAL